MPVKRLPYSNYLKHRNKFLKVRKRCNSWNINVKKKWQYVPPESFFLAAKEFHAPLGLDIDQKDEKLYHLVYEKILYIITSNSIRDRSLLIDFIFQMKISRKITLELTGKVSYLWNIVRRLPYTDEEIAKSLSKLVTNIFYFNRNQRQLDNSRHAFLKTTLKDPILMKYGWKSGPSVRSYVSGNDLKACLRNDINNIVDRDFVWMLKEPMHFLFFCNEPYYLYNFHKLNSLYITNILPNQIFLTGTDGLTFNSIAKVERFGIA